MNEAVTECSSTPVNDFCQVGGTDTDTGAEHLSASARITQAHAHEFQRSRGFDATSSGQDVADGPGGLHKASPRRLSERTQQLSPILIPSNSVDYEGELGVVIGRGGRAISRAAAMNHVFGYTIINDVTARTLQSKHKQWFLGKSFDSFCPMGRTVVIAGAIADPTLLRLETRVNGEIRQKALVSDLIFDIPTLIEAISLGITLSPGDIVATVTPEGVGIGFKPPKYFKAGDTVTITIDPIGSLTNPVR